MIGKLWLGFILAAATFQAAAQAQYPSRAIHMIIPYAPGGPTDVGGRILAQGLSDALGQPVVSENRPGAAGTLGVAMLARAAPDGYTLGAIPNAGITSPFAMDVSVPYKLEDLAPLGIVCFDYSLVTVKADTRWQTIKEVMDYAKQNPGKLSYGAAGVGSMGHLSMEFLKLAYGVQIEFVPYAGSMPTITSLLGGHIDLSSANLSVSVPFIKAGKLKGLAVASSKRVHLLPDVPTVGESGKGDPPNFWLGVFLPAKTPAPVVEKLTKTLEQILKDSAMAGALEKAGFILDYRNPAETRKFIAEEIKTIANIAKSVNLK